MNAKKLVNEAVSLPIEQRVAIVDTLLKSLNRPENEIDNKWLHVSKKRLNDLRSKEVEGIPADKVFSRIWSKY